ncbi:MAG TPA: FAD:protein FMN transferase [Nitrospiraceae bacterium]|nr:FAD:protein FMN transferase [Nitrospiraceae bacterium]
MKQSWLKYTWFLSISLVFLIDGCVRMPAAFDSPRAVKRSQLLMGTLVEVSAVGPSEQVAGRAVSAALAEIRRLEELLSTWIPTSELSRVNAAAGREPVKVGPDTLLILRRSLEMARLTEGAFNIAIGPAVKAWSVTENPRIPDTEELDRLQRLLDLSEVQIDEQRRTVFLTRPGMRIDVGGIGKGFAADQAVARMREAGASAGVVAVSGDIKTFGRIQNGQPFLFGIRHPRREDALLARVELWDEAISTAGDYERFFERNGVRYHHILDPRTLAPARGCQSVTVIAQEGIMADGLDTGIFVLGPERGLELVERLPNVEAVIVDREGKVWISSGLKDRVYLEIDPSESML